MYELVIFDEVHHALEGSLVLLCHDDVDAAVLGEPPVPEGSFPSDCPSKKAVNSSICP